MFHEPYRTSKGLGHESSRNGLGRKPVPAPVSAQMDTCANTLPQIDCDFQVTCNNTNPR
jgi:hypothetical protein